MEPVKIIGAGLAGCEAAWQLACRNIPVILYEMRPNAYPPAFHTDQFAELVLFKLIAIRFFKKCGRCDERRNASTQLFDYVSSRCFARSCGQCISG